MTGRNCCISLEFLQEATFYFTNLFACIYSGSSGRNLTLSTFSKQKNILCFFYEENLSKPNLTKICSCRTNKKAIGILAGIYLYLQASNLSNLKKKLNHLKSKEMILSVIYNRVLFNCRYLTELIKGGGLHYNIVQNIITPFGHVSTTTVTLFYLYLM